MKKISLFIILIVFSLTLIACIDLDNASSNSDSLTISAPINVQISNDVLSWNPVSDATEYVVVVGTTRRTVTSTTFNLSSLNLQQGTYEVSVIAKRNTIESNPSNKVSYTISNPNEVHYLSDDRFLERIEDLSLYRFFFVFLNSDQERISSNATINIRIVNNEGIEVYKKAHKITNNDFGNWTWERNNPRTEFYGTVEIPFDQITPGNASYGTMYFQVNVEGNVNFNEHERSINITELPVAFDLQLPNTPLEVSILSTLIVGRVWWKVNITEISYEYNAARQRLTVYFEGQKTYCINNGNFQLKVLDLNMTFIPSDEMLLEHAKSIQDITKPTMEFLTPTSFKSNNEYLLFPSVEHIIRNLINRWNNYSTCFIIDDEDAILSLIQSTRIAGYRLQSSYFRMKGTQIPGFRGEVRFSTKLSIPIGELYKIILYFAQFSGVGIKTSLGMGATKIITGNKS